MKTTKHLHENFRYMAPFVFFEPLQILLFLTSHGINCDGVRVGGLLPFLHCEFHVRSSLTELYFQDYLFVSRYFGPFSVLTTEMEAFPSPILLDVCSGILYWPTFAGSQSRLCTIHLCVLFHIHYPTKVRNTRVVHPLPEMEKIQ